MKSKREDQDYHLKLLEEIHKRGKDLEYWEFSFIQSLIRIRDSSTEFTLTRPQQVKLENIRERRVMG